MNTKKILKIKGYMNHRVAIYLTCLSLFAFISNNVVNAAELKNVRFAKLPGGQVQINVETDGGVGDPGVFSTANPARVAFDFFGVRKAFSESLIKVGVGNVDSVVAVETDDRTRLIVNLLDTTSYSSELTSNGYVITLDGPQFESNVSSSAAQTTIFSNSPELVSAQYINSVDFRRSKDGGGKIVVDLSDPSISANVKDQSGSIRLDFANTTLNPGLEKRLDVIDFATPVSSVDIFQNGSSVSLVVEANDRYRQLSYQSGNQFTLMVDPFKETEEEKLARENEENKFTGDRLSINFQKIEVRAALAVISDFTGINIVTSDDVDGELTLNLNDVPWDQALDVILKTKGLDKRESGDVIFVAPATVLAEQEQERKAAQEALAEIEPLISEVIKINYASAVQLREVLISEDESGGEGDNGGATIINLGGEGGSAESPGKPESNTAITKIRADDRSNSLIVTTTASNMVSLKQLIKKLDSPLRQVMIETRIVEAEDDFSRTLGAKLGFQRVTENAQIPFSGSTLATQSIIGASNAANTAVNNSLVDGGLTFSGLDNVDLAADGIGGESAASYALQLFKAGRGYANLISLELSALEANGRVKVVASPRLVAADNTEASIEQGQERLFSTTETDIGDDGAATTTTAFRVLEAELKLTVTPKITPDDRVIMNVEIRQDAFADIATGLINTKGVTTQVIVDNGETIVIGGIYQESDAETITKVPVLGDVPYLRNLFRKKAVSQERTELIVFLTPRIIDESLNLR